MLQCSIPLLRVIAMAPTALKPEPRTRAFPPGLAASEAARAPARRPLPPPVHIHARLRDGTEVVLQPLRPEDRDHLLAAWEHLSPRSRQMRFLHPMGKMPEALLDKLLSVDAEDHIAWTARTPDGRGLGIARYIRAAHGAPEAEMAITILDEAQGLGLGSLLLGIIMRSAVAHGVTRFTGLVLAENRGMRHLIADLGGSFDFSFGSGDALSFEIPVPARAEALPDTQTGRVVAALYRALPDWLPPDGVHIQVPAV